MQKFFENIFSGVGITDIIDILIVAFVIYKLLGLIKQTRAEQLMKGVLLLVVATFLSGLFNLHTINWILKGAVTLGAVAILVVFQPELRRALEYMGRSKIVKAPLREMDKEYFLINESSPVVDTFEFEACLYRSQVHFR